MPASMMFRPEHITQEIRQHERPRLADGVDGSTNLCGRLILSGAHLCNAGAGISAGPVRAIPARRAAGKPKDRRLPEPRGSHQRGAHDATRQRGSWRLLQALSRMVLPLAPTMPGKPKNRRLGPDPRDAKLRQRGSQRLLQALSRMVLPLAPTMLTRPIYPRGGLGAGERGACFTSLPAGSSARRGFLVLSCEAAHRAAALGLCST